MIYKENRSVEVAGTPTKAYCAQESYLVGYYRLPPSFLVK